MPSTPVTAALFLTQPIGPAFRNGRHARFESVARRVGTRKRFLKDEAPVDDPNLSSSSPTPTATSVEVTGALGGDFARSLCAIATPARTSADRARVKATSSRTAFENVNAPAIAPA